MTNPRDDGGQAFPSEFFETEHGDQVRAFAGSAGMTLRDYFAGQALAGMDGGWTPMFDWSVLTDGDYGGDEWHARARSERARYAYGQADAMLAERSK